MEIENETTPVNYLKFYMVWSKSPSISQIVKQLINVAAENEFCAVAERKQ